MTIQTYNRHFPKLGLDGEYDSQLEAKLSFAFNNLGIKRCTNFSPPLVLTFGKNHEIYSCKPDFYCEKLNLYIEVKGHKLNSKKTPSSAKNAISRQIQYRGYASDFDKLNNGFNHSKYKHAAIQRTLSPSHYIVIFDGPIPVEELEEYLRVGLICIPLLALPSYLGVLRFRSKGLDVKFNLGTVENYKEHKKHHTWLSGSTL